MAFVRGVIAPARRSGSRFRVQGSTSTKTGRAPACSTARPVKAAETAEVTTSSPGPTPSARRASARASVPFPTATASRAPSASASSRSKAVPLGAEDEPAGVEDPRHRLVELAPVGGHVGPEVHEGHGEGRAHR